MAHIKANKLENGNYEVFGFQFTPKLNEEYVFLDAWLQPDDTYEYKKVTVEANTKFEGRLKGLGHKCVKVEGCVEDGELYVKCFKYKKGISPCVRTKEELLDFIE